MTQVATKNYSIALRFTFLIASGLIVFLLTACGTSSTTGTASTPPTSTPAASPTIAPTTQPTPSPTPGVTPQATPQQLSLAFSCGGSKDGVTIGATRATVCVRTLPGTKLTIQVKYCNGQPDPSRALQGTFTADSKGSYTWNWKPIPDCKSQNIWAVNVDVNAQLNGQRTSSSYSGMA